MTARRRHLTAALLLTGVVVACYADSLPNGFTYDDEVLIVTNEMVKDWRALPLLASKAYFERSTVVSYRPLLTFTYVVDYGLWGLNPFGFHLTNLLLHLLTTLLVYALLTQLLPSPPGGCRLPIGSRQVGGGEGRVWTGVWPGPALVGAALFAVHPVLTGAVDNIGHRSDLLAGGLVLLALCCLVRQEQSLRRRWLLAGGLGAYGFALLAKETAAALPGLLLLVDWARAREKHAWWRLRLPLYTGVALLTGGYLVLRFVLMNNPIEWASSLPPFWTRLRGWPYATWLHLRLLILPLDLSAEHVFPLPAQITDPMILFPTAVIASLLLGLLWLWYRGERLACLGGAWILVALGPVSNLIPNFSLPVAERYLYLPAVGFALLLTLALTRLRSQAVAVGLAAALIVMYGALTLERHPVWHDNFSLWQDTVEKIPGEPIAHNNLGAQYEARGEFTRALREYAWAAYLASDFATAYQNAGWVYLRQDRLDLAAHQFEQVLRLHPGYPPALAQLGLVYRRQGRGDRAIALYRDWLTEHPASAEAHSNLGTLYAEGGRLAEAVAAYRDALRLNPTLLGVHENLATVYARQGRLTEAQAERAAALSGAPR